MQERKDRTCLNCGDTVAGRYCQTCGQENLEPKESTWHLILHFFNDFTHFDGKFFSTLNLLLFRPGLLTTEYIRGRRAAYLNPIRMFLFVSFLVFLVLFSMPSRTATPDAETSRRDSLERARDTANQNVIWRSNSDTSEQVVMARSGYVTLSRNRLIIRDMDSTYSGYVARQKALPKYKRDNLVRTWMTKKLLAFSEYSREHPDTIVDEVLSRFKHSVPQMFFVSIPVFALLLYLLYIRRRRTYYYVSHSIFSIHFYCAAYIIFMIFSLVGWIANEVTGLQVLAGAVTLVYLYIAMRRFYKQGRLKTFVKFCTLSFVMSIFLSFLTLGFLFNSMLKVPVNH